MQCKYYKFQLGQPYHSYCSFDVIISIRICLALSTFIIGRDSFDFFGCSLLPNWRLTFSGYISIAASSSLLDETLWTTRSSVKMCGILSNAAVAWILHWYLLGHEIYFLCTILFPYFYNLSVKLLHFDDLFLKNCTWNQNWKNNFPPAWWWCA